MKKIALLVVVVSLASATAASAQYRTNSNRGFGGYGTGSNSSNTYVAPSYNSHTGSMTSGHYRTNPNNTQYDNYGTRGNINPYTGAVGTRSPRY